MRLKKNTVSFIGSENLPTGDKLINLKQKISMEIDKALEEGFLYFLFGADLGFSLLCAEIVAEKARLINFHKPLRPRLIAIIPWEEQANDYPESVRELYFNILMPQSYDVITLQEHFTSDCIKKRDEYLLRNSSRIIAYFPENKKIDLGVRDLHELINLN